MYFTKEDFKKIEDWLRTHSIKESEFDNINIIQGNEYITAVQNGINKRICLKDFINMIIKQVSTCFINIPLLYNENYITLEQAISIVECRTSGIYITFTDKNREWVTYQFIGDPTQWNNINLWIKK